MPCFELSQYNCWKKTNIPWTLNLLFLYQFHAQKALFKVPKICNINFWIENDPPTPSLWHFYENSSDLVAGPFPKRWKHCEQCKQSKQSKQCLQAVQEAMLPPSLMAFCQFLNHDLIMISQVENIYLDVKTALEKILTQATWMDEETRNRWGQTFLSWPMMLVVELLETLQEL